MELEEHLLAKICCFLRTGANLETAATASGVPKKEAEKLKKDLIPEQIAKIEESTAQFELIMLQRIAAEGGPAMAKWALQKSNPEKYGDPDKKNNSDFLDFDLGV